MTIHDANRITANALSALALFGLLAAPVNASIPNRVTAVAAGSKISPDAVLPPNSNAYGHTYQEWSALWWQWFLPLTTEELNSCSIGGSGHVAFLLAGPATCAGAVSTGTPLFFPIANVECSTLEAPPFYGATASERRACAESYLPLLTAPGQTLAADIDGVPVQNISIYKTTSPDYTFTIPGADNVFGIVCGSYPCVGQSTAAGYYVLVTPLPPGVHMIHIIATGFGVDTTWVLAVRPGR
jgi:hypothetical protein